ncbi:protein MIZU-KUSSEI 1-like [Pyrus communis]|uniref:protein MIZU-KUSSEI 1-like n=1 Tax=Pyrus communis TaxID=23211 RepID=UPI0035C15987
MKSVSMARSLQDSSSKRHFLWTNKVGNEEEEENDVDHVVLPSLKSSSSASKPKSDEEEEKKQEHDHHQKQQHGHEAHQLPRRKLQAAAVSRLRSVLTTFGKNRSSLPLGLGPRVVGTLFGSRRGHVHFALQRDPSSHPAFLIELATPISGLVKEMASGLVRIALECDKDHKADLQKKKDQKSLRLLEEPVWRTFCNGKKYGFASKRECGAKEWKVLKAVEPISMGAGVLPPSAAVEGNEAEAGSESEGELMYMRAKFERIVGSRDSEAFYMMNPDSNGAPELSIYLLRV